MYQVGEWGQFVLKDGKHVPAQIIEVTASGRVGVEIHLETPKGLVDPSVKALFDQQVRSQLLEVTIVRINDVQFGPDCGQLWMRE